MIYSQLLPCARARSICNCRQREKGGKLLSVLLPSRLHPGSCTCCLPLLCACGTSDRHRGRGEHSLAARPIPGQAKTAPPPDNFPGTARLFFGPILSNGRTIVAEARALVGPRRGAPDIHSRHGSITAEAIGEDHTGRGAVSVVVSGGGERVSDILRYRQSHV